MRWRGYCTHCGRAGVELESRPEHGERAWCDRCAGRPATTPALPSVGAIDTHVTEEETSRWWAERCQRYGGHERGPDVISRTLARLEAVGLPVEGVGIPGVAGSLCPLCGAGMGVLFHGAEVALRCVTGCPEDAIAARIREGRCAR